MGLSMSRLQEFSMVARCFIPTCNCEFRELSKGRLFVLPPNRDFSSRCLQAHWNN